MFARNQRRTAFPLLVITLILLSVVCTPTTGYASANAGAAYIALGDSIEFGLGAISEPGYVYQLHSELPGYLGVDSVDLYNLAQPGATVRDIKQQQLKPAVATIENYEGDKVVILWGGGGNDLLQFILSPKRQLADKRSVASIA
ncbi:MAG: SGNH/GDSL hydrolase family protein [Caldilineaceae bacterium]